MQSGSRAVLWPGSLIGIGLVGVLDELVLHQLLGWHDFYDKSTSAIGLVSDGILHVASTVPLVLGAHLLFSDRGRLVGDDARRAWTAVLLGGGAFNFYDGTIQHKLLKLHQVRPSAPAPEPVRHHRTVVAGAGRRLGAAAPDGTRS